MQKETSASIQNWTPEQLARLIESLAKFDSLSKVVKKMTNCEIKSYLLSGDCGIYKNIVADSFDEFVFNEMIDRLCPPELEEITE